MLSSFTASLNPSVLESPINTSLSAEIVSGWSGLLKVPWSAGFCLSVSVSCSGVGVDAGIGYVNYRSKGTISQLENYNTTCSTVGGNMGIAYEYAFDSRLGIRLGVNCLYAKIKGLHKNTSIGELSIRPREKFHLIVPSLEIGLSYYIVQW